MSHNEIARPDPAESGPLPYGLVRLGFQQPPATPAQGVRGPHTDEHSDWDQGGYCNALVTNEHGDGDVCGYRQPMPVEMYRISVKDDPRVPGMVEILLCSTYGQGSSIRFPPEVLPQLQEAVREYVGTGRPRVTPEALEGVACALTTGNDMEAYASAFNDGYETAVVHGLVDDPELAGDWLEEQLERARRAVRDVRERDLQESEHRFDPIGEADVAVCALCGLDPEATPHQHFEILYKAIDGVRAVAPGDQPDVMYDEKMLEGYQLALADVNAVLDHYFGPVKS